MAYYVALNLETERTMVKVLSHHQWAGVIFLLPLKAKSTSIFPSQDPGFPGQPQVIAFLVKQRLM